MTSIATNINASSADQAIGDSARQVADSTAQLATGCRINSAADDTAGMAINSKLSAESISLQRAMRNANDGISMLQTADHAAGSMSQALVRMREIAMQATNDTNSDSDRLALDNEFTQLREHLNTTIDSTQWNGKKMLDGSMSSVNLQIGASSGDGHSVDLADFRSLTALTAAGVGSRSDALSALDAIDSSLASIDETRVKWGAPEFDS